MEEWTPFLGLAAIVFFVWVFTDHPALSWYTGERSLYPITCDNEKDWSNPVSSSFLNVKCPTGSKPLPVIKKTLIAIKANQIVVERNELGLVRRYNDCVVYDADNWSCNYQGQDQGKRFFMEDGMASSSALPFSFVSKATWYWYKWVKRK